MTTAEIVLLILGFICISVSFFIGNRQKQTSGSETLPEGGTRDIWNSKEEELVRNQIDSILKEEKENVITETTEYLNRKSNEKIMEFDEFSSQLMEKINHNHEEVVFMYNMLSEKEKELKEDVVKKPAVKKKEAVSVAKPKTTEKTEAVSSHIKKERTSQAAKKKAPELHSETLEEGSRSDDANEKIIQMYKQGKSVLEISKEMNIGQGEVKLMIALYGGKNEK